jgi:hypothetical protein
MKTITEGHPDFKTFERSIFEIMCRIACGLIRQYLEWRDLGIMALRDKKEYRLLYSQETTVKTIMGEVGFSRRYYKKISGGYAYLLDEELGIFCGCGLASENLAEQIVVECTDKSFRKAAGDINSFTTQPISAMGVWGIFQKYGETIEQQVARLKELDNNGSTGHIGNVSSQVLFDEYDDVWVSRQKEKRRKRGGTVKGTDKKPGKKPVHVGIAYTGWGREKDGSHRTLDKIAYASFGSASMFTATFEALLRQRFDMDGVERRVTNGDGETWIRTTAEDNDSVLQLDPYHRSKAITKAVSDKGDRKLLNDAVNEKDVEKVLSLICELAWDEQDESAREKLVKLYGYFHNNKDIFLTWQERGINLPDPPESVEYRSMGVQESNNYCLITHRMKHRRGSWSERGGGHMAKALCFRSTVGLDAILGTLPVPQPAEARPEPLSAAKALMHDGRGYGADWLYAKMPFENAFKTIGREAIRDMLRLKPLSSLPFLQGSGSNKMPRLIFPKP